MEVILRFLTVFRARHRLFLVVFVVVLAGAVAGAFLKRPVYESTAALLVKLDLRSVSISRSEIRRDIAILQAEEAVISQTELLQTRELIERLIDELPPEIFKGKSPHWFVASVLDAVDFVKESIIDALAALKLIDEDTPRYQMVKRIKKGLSVYPVRKAQIILVSYRSKARKAPPVVLNTLIRLYLVKFAELYARAEGYVHYSVQSSRLKVELEMAENALVNLKARYDIADLEIERIQLLERIDTLTTMLDGTRRVGVVAEAPADPQTKPRHVTSHPSAPPPAIAPPQILQLTSRLDALRIDRAKNLVSFAPGHQSIRELDSQIDKAEALLSKQIEQLVRTVEAVKKRLAFLSEVEPELNSLERQVKIGSDAYVIYSKAAVDRRLSQEQEARIIIQVVDPPSLPYSPVSPNRLTLILAGMGLALFLALGTVVLVEWYHTGSPAAKKDSPSSSAAAP